LSKGTTEQKTCQQRHSQGCSFHNLRSNVTEDKYQSASGTAAFGVLPN
jgi:hypothetical protein